MKSIYHTLTFILFFLIAEKISAQTISDEVSNETAYKMVKKYNGFLRFHNQTDGVIITAGELRKLLQGKSDTDSVTILFARTLKNTEDADRKNTRPTLLLKAYSAEKKTDVYYNLSAKGDLCPEPPCAPEQ
jgi:hypothetical protein